MVLELIKSRVTTEVDQMLKEKGLEPGQLGQPKGIEEIPNDLGDMIAAVSLALYKALDEAGEVQHRVHIDTYVGTEIVTSSDVKNWHSDKPLEIKPIGNRFVRRALNIDEKRPVIDVSFTAPELVEEKQLKYVDRVKDSLLVFRYNSVVRLQAHGCTNAEIRTNHLMLRTPYEANLKGYWRIALLESQKSKKVRKDHEVLETIASMRRAMLVKATGMLNPAQGGLPGLGKNSR